MLTIPQFQTSIDLCTRRNQDTNHLEYPEGFDYSDETAIATSATVRHISISGVEVASLQ